MSYLPKNDSKLIAALSDLFRSQEKNGFVTLDMNCFVLCYDRDSFQSSQAGQDGLWNGMHLLAQNKE